MRRTKINLTFQGRIQYYIEPIKKVIYDLKIKYCIKYNLKT